MFTPQVVKVVEIGGIEFTRQATEHIDPKSSQCSHIAQFCNTTLDVTLYVHYTDEGTIRSSYLEFGKIEPIKVMLNLTRDVSNVTLDVHVLMQIVKWANAR